MATTKALWEKEIVKLNKRLDPISSEYGKIGHGASHPCIMGCGKQVRGERVICRSCRRKAKRNIAKLEYKERKSAKTYPDRMF